MHSMKSLRETLESRDIVITLPSNVEWDDYEKELEKVRNEREVLNFKVPVLPKHRPNKVYLCYRGNVIGWMKCCGMINGDSFDCTTTGKHWEGKFIQRTGEFHKIDPIQMKGFQGFRYFSI